MPYRKKMCVCTKIINGMKMRGILATALFSTIIIARKI